mmetsp:Transcript_27482/g.88732  ORF Transcript_27482/g.88732 Transcript_27482/m.88732 type:complete len:466 (-) Transcript_27482:1648-3045(-)
MRLASVGIVERLKDLEDSAGALDDVAAVAHLLGTDSDREEAAVEALEHRRVRGAGGEGRKHVLVVLVIADAKHKVDGRGGLRLEEGGVGERALVDTGDAHLHLALCARVRDADTSPLEMLLERCRQLPSLEAAIIRVGIVVAPARRRFLPLHVDPVCAQHEPLKDRPCGVLPPLLRRRQLSLGPDVPMRSKHAEAQLSSQPEAAHRPEACLQVARAAARDDMHRVGRVGGQRLQAVECGRRRCQGAADEVMEEFEVIQHLLLLDERAVQAQHDQPAVGLPVGAHEGLGRQRRQRLARQRLGAKVAQPERGARGRLSGGQAGAGAAHVLHGHVEPGGSGVRGDEGVVLGEAGGALVGRHGEGGVELLDDMLDVKGVDAHAPVEDVRATDELGKHHCAARLLDRLGEHVLEREQVEPVLHRTIEQQVDHTEESKSEVDRPALGLDLLPNLHVVNGVITKGLLDAPDH